MLHAFKLGPLPLGKGNASVYAAVGPKGFLLPEFERSDGEGLRALLRAAGGEPLRCEPALFSAAAKLGLATEDLPREALVARAGLATALASGPSGMAGAVATNLLLDAFARFWRARPWTRFDGDTPVGVTIAASGRASGREASVMGASGEQPGLALHDEPGSVTRVLRLMDTGTADEVLRISSVAVSLDDQPAWAVRAVEEAYGIPGVPTAIALRNDVAGPASAEDLAALGAALVAFASLMPDRCEASAAVEVGALRCEATVIVPEHPMRHPDGSGPQHESRR